MQLIHLADTHLGKQQYGYEFREFDGYELFREVIENAIRDHIRLVVISGDLFDEPRPRNRALRNVINCFKELSNHGAKVVLIPGDHDYPKRRDTLPLYVLEDVLDNVVLLGVPTSKREFRTRYVSKEYGLVFYALPYIPFKKRARELIPGFLIDATNFFRENGGLKHILLAHYSVKEYLPFDAVLEIGDIPGVTYAAFGHIHNRVKTLLPKGGVLAYPGSIDIFSVKDIVDWREHGKGYNIVDLSKEPDPSMIEWVDLDIRRQYVYEVSSDKLMDVLEWINRELESVSKKPVIVHLTIRAKPSSRVDISRVVEKIPQELAVIRYDIRYVEEGESVKVDYSIEYDEVDTLAKYMGSSREVAQLVYEIVEAIASGTASKEYVEERLERIADLWRTSSLLKGMERGDEVRERIEKLKKDLMQYLTSG